MHNPHIVIHIATDGAVSVESNDRHIIGRCVAIVDENGSSQRFVDDGHGASFTAELRHQPIDRPHLPQRQLAVSGPRGYRSELDDTGERLEAELCEQFPVDDVRRATSQLLADAAQRAVETRQNASSVSDQLACILDLDETDRPNLRDRISYLIRQGIPEPVDQIAERLAGRYDGNVEVESAIEELVHDRAEKAGTRSLNDGLTTQFRFLLEHGDTERDLVSFLQEATGPLSAAS